jgi:hypothetical protein
MEKEKEKEQDQQVALPNLNVNVNVPAEMKKEELVKSDQLVGYVNEALQDIQDDRKEIDEVLKSFLEMVMNEGDATTSSKEAVVNLLKLKSESVDKKTRIIDLLMRAYLKERDTYKTYFNAHQHNEFKIEDNSRRRQLLKAIHNEVENNGDK